MAIFEQRDADIDTGVADPPSGRSTDNRTFLTVTGETDQLAEVALCPPSYLAPVPCCSVTREHLRDGFETITDDALWQHVCLRDALERAGVTCRIVPPTPAFPDLCFTRDVAVSTPWGLTILNPAMPHRADEAGHFATAAAAWYDGPVRRITEGMIEGGDVCVARPGLLIIGVSGERTNETGADAFAAPFQAAGWDILRYRFDPHFLHLDTLFCLLDERHALACTEVLDDAFLDALAARGIDVLPVTYKEARLLGCNVLSIDGRTILAGTATPRVSAMMRATGYTVVELAIAQFAACGGGIHCLTMPLGRSATRNR